MDYNDSDYDEDDESYQSSSDATRLEIANVLDEEFKLPQGLAEDSNIFREFMSVSTWQSLSISDRQHLQKFLPNFPENDIFEKNVTLRRLFNRENFRFGSPLNAFHSQLQAGHFRPDIAHLRQLMQAAEQKQRKEQMKRHSYELLKDVIIGRRLTLEEAYNTSPGPLKVLKSSASQPSVDPVTQRVKKRYFQELSAVRSEVGQYSQSSEDENYQEGAPRTLSKKQRHKLNLLEGCLQSLDMTMVVSTLSTKPSGFDLESHITNTSNPYQMNEDQLRRMLVSHKRRRLSNEKSIDLQTSGISLKDVAIRTQFGQKRLSSKSTSRAGSPSHVVEKQRKRQAGKTKVQPEPTETKKIKKEEETEKRSDDSTDDEVSSTMLASETDKNIDVEYSSPTNIPQNQKLMEKQAQEQRAEQRAEQLVAAEPPESCTVEVVQPLEPNIPDTNDLMQDTHACFFSLLRDVICSTSNHRMSFEVMEQHLRTWEANPISPLNDWFTLVDEPWSALLQSGLSFLSADYPDLQPEDFVPYIEYKPHMRTYQWIGAGRDSDSHLVKLCSHWLDRKDDVSQSGAAASGNIRESTEELMEDVAEESMDELEDGREGQGLEEATPPACSSWLVHSSTEEEKRIFQEQERERFENPHKAFTYRMHGFESIVGPVKGIYTTHGSGPVLKPRGHNLLAANRPKYITILALVRDAAARLPNGEGTRADICTLIRDSQYLDLSSASENTLQNLVSGALDRLHGEVDACVKFDTKRKLWMYLHRARSEGEMEKMHQHYQGMTKSVKKAPRKKVAKKGEETEGAVGGGEGVKVKKQKGKQNLSMQQTLKNINPPLSTSSIPAATTTAYHKADQADMTASKEEVLAGLMSLGVREHLESVETEFPNLTTEHQVHHVIHAQADAVKKIPTAVGQSLLNQETLQKAVAGLRVLKAKPQTVQVPTVKVPDRTQLPVEPSPVSAPLPGTISAPVQVPVTVSATVQVPVSVPGTSVVSMQMPVQSSSLQSVMKPENRTSQEIITSSGKKILIQTSFAGVRAPVKFVTSNANQSTAKIISMTTAPGVKQAGTQAGVIRPEGVTILKQGATGKGLMTAQLVSPQYRGVQLKNVGGEDQQFVMDTGQKVHFITHGSTHSLGQIQSIEVGSGHSQTHETQETQPQPDRHIQLAVTKTGLNVNLAKNMANVRMVSCQGTALSDASKSTISLLTQAQKAGQTVELTTDAQSKPQAKIQLVQQKMSQIVNMSNVHLVGARAAATTSLNKATVSKNAAPILTGVKLVNTHQGVKMVATSSTMVQSAGQAHKGSSTLTKTLGQQAAVTAAAAKAGQRPAQIITVENLLQNTGQLRVTHPAKGSTSLIQLPTSSVGLPQFAVVSQGNIFSMAGQHRVLQTQHLTSVGTMPATQSSLVTTTPMTSAGKTVVTAVAAKPVQNIQTSAGTPVRMGAGVNLATIAGKPVILTSGTTAKTQHQPQNVILTSQTSGAGQTLLLAQPSAVRTQTAPATVTVVQQGTSQQILLPAGFQTGTINLKALQGLQGLKVIPLTQKGRQQVLARIVKTGNEGTSGIQPGDGAGTSMQDK